MPIQVSYGDTREFNNLLYGEKDPRTISYLANQFTAVSNVLTDAGASFMSNMKSIYDSFNGSEALRIARAARNKVASVFQYDGICSLWELGKIQNASLTMQRWVMAEPSLRKMYFEQRVDGYSGTYVDANPDVIGREHYDYRRVMDGMLVVDDDGEEHITHYYDELLEGDRDLDITEKVDIRATWEIVADLLKYGKSDPTDVWDGKL